MIAPDDIDLWEIEVASFAAEFHAIYADLDAAVKRLAPVCTLSGRCCRFEEYGHTLFLSAPEAALLLAEAPAPSGPLDDGATCPWQDARGLCSARDARPLGCRVYFCDPTYQDHAPILSETFLNRIKSLVDSFDLPWGYAPLHHHLKRARAAGRFPGIAAPETESEPPNNPSDESGASLTRFFGLTLL